MSGELTTGRTIFILAVVVGCFAILWPKVFYPMLTGSLSQAGPRAEPTPHPHARPERPSQLHPESMHPALREKGRTIPHRTIEKQARPGPMPGIRPPMGAGGHIVSTNSNKGGSGAMGIIMPLYTIGIIIFFMYTIMKVLSKKSEEEEDSSTPKLKDFHLDPEYRKYVFAEEYLDSSNASHRDLLRRQDRENSKQRRRQDSAASRDTKIEDEQMDQLRRRLEETERAMEKLMSQMGSVTDKLTAAKITEVLSHAQAQARILKMGMNLDLSSTAAEVIGVSTFPAPFPINSTAPTTISTRPSAATTSPKVKFEPIPQHIFFPMEIAEGGSDDDFTTSEVFTNTLSDDYSLPLALQRHLEELKVKDAYLKGTSATNFVNLSPISPIKISTVICGNDDNFHQIDVESTSLHATNDLGFGSPLNEIDTPIIKQNKSTEILHDEIYLSDKASKENKYTDDLGPDHNLLDLNTKEIDIDDLVLLSDIAMRDQLDMQYSNNSSDNSETGADVSDLKSYDDDEEEGFLTDLPANPEVEVQQIPEFIYFPECGSPKHLELVEHSTQTDVEKRLSVLNVENTYQNSDNERFDNLNFILGEPVNEIFLDATLPSDSQLLVRDSRTGSSLSDHIEIDASDSENEACIITSQVSLAFVGIEQNDGKHPVPAMIPKSYSTETHMILDEINLPNKEILLEKKTIRKNPLDYSSDGSTLNGSVSDIRKKENSTNEILENIPKDFHKTMSFESVDLTSDLLEGPVQNSFIKDINIYNIARPSSPVPPKALNTIPNIAITDQKYVNLKPNIKSLPLLEVNSFAANLVSTVFEEVFGPNTKIINKEIKNRNTQDSFVLITDTHLHPEKRKSVEQRKKNTTIYKMKLGEVGERREVTNNKEEQHTSLETTACTTLTHLNNPSQNIYSSQNIIPVCLSLTQSSTNPKIFASTVNQEVPMLMVSASQEISNESKRNDDNLRNWSSDGSDYDINRRG